MKAPYGEDIKCDLDIIGYYTGIIIILKIGAFRGNLIKSSSIRLKV